jgi:conflict system STAND superfamily ATPase
VEALIALLASKRLVSTSGLGRESPMENYVEVSHEALIREWPALREWLKENREDPGINCRENGLATDQPAVLRVSIRSRYQLPGGRDIAYAAGAKPRPEQGTGGDAL